jgi:cytochrome c peroxidase
MKSPHNPDGQDWIDQGLGAFLKTTPDLRQYAEENMGKQKVPTLRNVDLRPSPNFIKTFMHNGAFSSLKEVVQFYNRRDVAGQDWPPPEVEENLNTDEMGNLGLTEREEDLIVLFMKTLSDRIDPSKIRTTTRAGGN